VRRAPRAPCTAPRTTCRSRPRANDAASPSPLRSTRGERVRRANRRSTIRTPGTTR
jgi:hypothetical protein